MPPLPLRDLWELTDPKSLADLMEQQQHTYRSLADAAGVAKSPIQRMVEGKQRACAPDTARRIAAALGVEAETLFKPRTAVAS